MIILEKFKVGDLLETKKNINLWDVSEDRIPKDTFLYVVGILGGANNEACILRRQEMIYDSKHSRHYVLDYNKHLIYWKRIKKLGNLIEDVNYLLEGL